MNAALATLLGLGAGTISFAQAQAAAPDALTGGPEAGRRMALAFGVTGATPGTRTRL